MTHVALRYAPDSAADLYPTTPAPVPLNDTEGQRIRMRAADLFSQGRVQEALQMTQRAVQQHPHSPDVWVMHALLCEVCHDWPAAANALEHLLALQGDSAPPDTWMHWVRVLRCDCQHQAAWLAAMQARQHHPQNPDLAREIAQMEDLGCGTVAKAA